MGSFLLRHPVECYAILINVWNLHLWEDRSYILTAGHLLDPMRNKSWLVIASEYNVTRPAIFDVMAATQTTILFTNNSYPPMYLCSVDVIRIKEKKSISIPCVIIEIYLFQPQTLDQKTSVMIKILRSNSF